MSVRLYVGKLNLNKIFLNGKKRDREREREKVNYFQNINTQCLKEMDWELKTVAEIKPVRP